MGFHNKSCVHDQLWPWVINQRWVKCLSVCVCVYSASMTFCSSLHACVRVHQCLSVSVCLCACGYGRWVSSFHFLYFIVISQPSWFLDSVSETIPCIHCNVPSYTCIKTQFSEEENEIRRTGLVYASATWLWVTNFRLPGWFKHKPEALYNEFHHCSAMCLPHHILFIGQILFRKTRPEYVLHDKICFIQIVS